MKKWYVFLALVLCVCFPCQLLADTALRGYDKEDGYQYVSLGSFNQLKDGTRSPIVWRVLDVSGEGALLMSEYILFNNRIHPDDKEYIAFDAAWNQTELFALLNGPFEGNPLPIEEQEALKKKEHLGRVHIAEICFKDDAFTADEQALLVNDDEQGMVFLAEANDIKNADYGFANDKSRQGYGTPFALANGLFRYGNGSSPYWTRTQSTSYDYATRCTKVDGKIGYIRCVVMNEGVRPCIRLSGSAFETVSGEGTMADPFILTR